MITASSLLITAVALALLPFLDGTPAVPDEPTPTPEPVPDPAQPPTPPAEPAPEPVPQPVPEAGAATTFDAILADYEAKRAAAEKAVAVLGHSSAFASTALRWHGG